MELPHATLTQIRTGRKGRTVLLDSDTLEIASQVRALDPSLSVHWNEFGEYFVVVQTMDDGREKLVTTTTALDQRLVEHMRKIVHPSYDLVKEVDRLDAQAERDKEHRFAEAVGEHGEKLAHALRKDLEVKGKIIVPKGIKE